ncbi:MAG: aminoacetone oxidase family FAD-binding enzyme [Eubacteriales bacterium]|nr:aminoacetone oxidase family FAD-binding enzyme [Eubacteriales bacterium]
MRRIGIIGGGASGMMAAVAAARSGAQVTILEKRDRVGKKILATGNGRCNLSNRDFCVERDYRSHDIGKLSRYFEQFGVAETIAFFQDIGMLLTDRNGYLYPRSMQASAVLDLFLGELDRLSVRIVCECKISKIEKGKKGFLVSANQGNFSFDSLILSGGSGAGINGKEGLGVFDLAKDMGLPLYEPLPALTGLRCGERFFKALAGVRCMAAITLRIADGNRKKVYEETGELQLTDYGISGIPVFQFSRYASEALYEKRQVEAVINFLPEIAASEWKAFSQRQYEVCRGKSAGLLGSGILHKKIVQVLLAECGLKPGDIVSEDTKKRIFSMFERMRGLKVSVVGSNPMEQSQVCMGGVSLARLDENLQAKQIPGLFLCGEMLDVDGRCGGYNLQWAWSSGFIAGSAAAKGCP